MRDIPFILPDWPAPSNVRAAVTTRAGGASTGSYTHFNLGANTGEDPDIVAANRRRLAARLGLLHEPAWLRQVHGTTVIDAGAVNGTPEADASWTSLSGVACVVLTADCLPVLFCDRAGTRVAAAHGGWRGLAAGILANTVAAMDCAANEVLAWLGPAIGPDAFEVGPEVRAAFTASWPETAAAFRNGQGDRWFCDLYAIARVQLRALGVREISGGGFCTVTDERFYSYRRNRQGRDGGETGRMASLVWLEPRAVAK
jgi:YfiH family protein